MTSDRFSHALRNAGAVHALRGQFSSGSDLVLPPLRIKHMVRVRSRGLEHICRALGEFDFLLVNHRPPLVVLRLKLGTRLSLTRRRS